MTSLRRVCLHIMLSMPKNILPLWRGCWKPTVPFLFVISMTTVCSITVCEEPADRNPVYPLWNGQDSVADYAKKVNLPPTQTLDLGSGVKFDLVLIPAGQFVMGTLEYEKPVVGQMMTGISGGILLLVVAVWLIRARRNRKRPQFSISLMLGMTLVAAIGVWGGVRWCEALKFPIDLPTEHPAHRVMLTQPFYLGRYDVTQDQYQAVIGTNPSSFIGKNNPVDQVSWEDAQAFCKKLNDQTKANARLPTEAEWEYACRAGTTTRFYFNDSDSDLDRVAWYSKNSKGTTHPVGLKEPNNFGLNDMHGNVSQWCQDLWDANFYAKSPSANPQGPALGGTRLVRGGAWCYDPIFCRSAFRSAKNPTTRDYHLGFRVAVPTYTTP